MALDRTAEKLQDLDLLFQRLRTRRWHLYMQKWDCQNVVELGVYNGRNFMRMLAGEPRVAVAVDAWLDDGVRARNDTNLLPDEREKQYRRFLASVAEFPSVQVCRGYTFDVVKQFPDNYFDLAYIDADHTEEGSLRDMRDWWPKMRSGAAFTGDDYREQLLPNGVKFGVIEAVARFSREVGVEAHPLPRNGWGMIKP
jgi:hypothetical protein